MHLGSGRDLVVSAPGNSAETPSVAGLRVNGERWDETSVGGLGDATAALHDDDSTTSSTLRGDRPELTLGLKRTRTVRSDTLTSADDPSSTPAGRQLQGSTDGTTWRTLDTRDGERFAWGGSTRSFGVAEPGAYPHCRLRLTPRAKAGGIDLAEVELTGTGTYADAGTHPTVQQLRLRELPRERDWG